MIINRSEHDNFYQRWQRLEWVRCGSSFTAIKIIKYLLPWVTFVAWGLFFQFTPGEEGWVLMNFSFYRIFTFLHRHKLHLGGGVGMLWGLRICRLDHKAVLSQANNFSSYPVRLHCDRTFWGPGSTLNINTAILSLIQYFAESVEKVIWFVHCNQLVDVSEDPIPSCSNKMHCYNPDGS